MRAPRDGEILVGVVAGQILAAVQANSSVNVGGLALEACVSDAVDQAEAIVAEVVRRTDDREREIGFNYECRHGHVTTHDSTIDDVPNEVECGFSHRSNDYEPCTKTAGLVGRADGEPMPAELPPQSILVDQHWSRNQLGRDRRHGISVDFREGTLTPEEVEDLQAKVITAIEQWIDDGRPLQLLHDDPASDLV